VLDQVDAAFLDDLHRAWAEAPPLRRMIATYLGHRPRAKPSKNYHELLAMFPGGAIR
jgi:hypothetical protein